MKKLEHFLLSKEPVSEIVIGNTAIVRAMIEAGVKVVTSYPGSPTPEIAIAIKSISEENRPFYFEYSVNEKVATEVAFGASINGHLSCVFFKSVGINVAADTFVQLSHMNLLGGIVIVLGDDPGANSSQNEQDNRHFAHLSYTPVFEPATPSEVYQMFIDAAELSKIHQHPVILRLTTHVCHAKEKVQFNSWNPITYDFAPKFNTANGPYVAITKIALEMKKRALNKLQLIENFANNYPLNKLNDNINNDKGIITFGAPYLSLLDVLQSAHVKPDILKLAIIYPLPRKLIADFLRKHKQVKVLEELDNLLEKDVKVIAYEEKIDCKIIGKNDLADFIGEYTPDKVYEVLYKTWPEILEPLPTLSNTEQEAPARPPQLCPGCGHRPVFAALRKSLPNHAITVGDIGCHTLGFLQPYEMGQVVVCMGHSSGTAAGLSLFNRSRPVIAFIGDSTFFHAGIPALINAVFNHHKFILIVLENGTTGMTGHQNHPGSGANFNNLVEAIPIKKVLDAIGVKHIFETGAYNQQKLIEHLAIASEFDDVSVIIAEHPCMLKKTREDKQAGSYKNNKINIIQEQCTRLETCITQFACPSFQRNEDGSIWVHEDLCIGDGSCIQTCSSKAIKLKKK